MYPGLSHDEIIEECLKELKHHFEVGPEVALISAEKGVQCVPFDESLQKKFPYFEGTYEVFDVPHAIQKDLSCTPPRFLIFFKAQDADALNAAFKEYSAAVLNKAERPSVLAKLHDLAQVIANLPDKVRHKEEERGL